jgi:hypothetical protein
VKTTKLLVPAIVQYFHIPFFALVACGYRVKEQTAKRMAMRFCTDYGMRKRRMEAQKPEGLLCYYYLYSTVLVLYCTVQVLIVQVLYDVVVQVQYKKYL